MLKTADPLRRVDKNKIISSELIPLKSEGI